jgi:hypothetical protein
MEPSIVMPLITAGIALIGAFGGQIISTSAALKMKRLELAYGKKSQAYQAFLSDAFQFGFSPNDETRSAYLKAYFSLKLIASSEISLMLDKRPDRPGEAGGLDYEAMRIWDGVTGRDKAFTPDGIDHRAEFMRILDKEVTEVLRGDLGQLTQM